MVMLSWPYILHEFVVQRSVLGKENFLKAVQKNTEINISTDDIFNWPFGLQ